MNILIIAYDDPWKEGTRDVAAWPARITPSSALISGGKDGKMTGMQALVEWTLNLANTRYALWGLFGVAFAESSFFLVPPDILQIALSVAEPKKAFLYASISLAGSVLGAALGYGIGLAGGRPLLRRLLSEKKMALIEDYYHRYDVWAIGIAGFTPIPYKLFTISGGAFKIDFPRFIAVSIIARGARFFAVAAILYLLGPSVQNMILRNVNIFSIVFVILLIGGFWAASHLVKR